MYPLYIATAIIACVLMLIDRADSLPHPVTTLFFNAFALQGIGVGALYPPAGESLVGPAWSISVEAGAYLLFPALVAITVFRSRALAGLCALAAAAVIVALGALPTPWLVQAVRRGPLDVYSTMTLWPLIRCLAGFTLGLVAWRVARSREAEGVPRNVVGDAVVLLAIGAFVLGRVTDGLIVLAFVPLILQLCTDTSPLARLLGTPVAMFFGEISYAVYLIHTIESHFLADAFLWPRLTDLGVPHAWTAARFLTFLTVIPLAWQCFRFIEKPSRRVLRAWFSEPARRIETEPAAP